MISDEQTRRVESQQMEARRLIGMKSQLPRFLLLCFVFCGLVGSMGCAKHISRPDLLAQIDAGAAPRIVDVRSSAEYDAARVPGAIHASFYSLLWNLDSLPATSANEDQPLVLYCEHGPRAGLARAQLWMAGAGPVLFMEGHMIAWKQDGLRIESGDASESQADPVPE